MLYRQDTLEKIKTALLQDIDAYKAAFISNKSVKLAASHFRLIGDSDLDMLIQGNEVLVCRSCFQMRIPIKNNQFRPKDPGCCSTQGYPEKAVRKILSKKYQILMNEKPSEELAEKMKTRRSVSQSPLVAAPSSRKRPISEINIDEQQGLPAALTLSADLLKVTDISPAAEGNDQIMDNVSHLTKSATREICLQGSYGDVQANAMVSVKDNIEPSSSSISQQISKIKLSKSPDLPTTKAQQQAILTTVTTISPAVSSLIQNSIVSIDNDTSSSITTANQQQNNFNIISSPVVIPVIGNSSTLVSFEEQLSSPSINTTGATFEPESNSLNFHGYPSSEKIDLTRFTDLGDKSFIEYEPGNEPEEESLIGDMSLNERGCDQGISNVDYVKLKFPSNYLTAGATEQNDPTEQKGATEQTDATEQNDFINDHHYKREKIYVLIPVKRKKNKNETQRKSGRSIEVVIPVKKRKISGDGKHSSLDEMEETLTVSSPSSSIHPIELDGIATSTTTELEASISRIAENEQFYMDSLQEINHEITQKISPDIVCYDTTSESSDIEIPEPVGEFGSFVSPSTFIQQCEMDLGSLEDVDHMQAYISDLDMESPKSPQILIREQQAIDINSPGSLKNLSSESVMKRMGISDRVVEVCLMNKVKWKKNAKAMSDNTKNALSQNSTSNPVPETPIGSLAIEEIAPKEVLAEEDLPLIHRLSKISQEHEISSSEDEIIPLEDCHFDEEDEEDDGSECELRGPRRIILDGGYTIYPELKKCMNLFTLEMEWCVVCRNRSSSDLCRFMGFRGTGKTIDNVDENVFINQKLMNIQPPQTSYPPTRKNEPKFKETNIDYINSYIQPTLSKILEQEHTLLKDASVGPLFPEKVSIVGCEYFDNDETGPPIYQRPNKSGYRQNCDVCGTAIFNSFLNCVDCGLEICNECLTNESSFSRLCTFNNHHCPDSEFIRLHTIDNAELKETIQVLEDSVIIDNIPIEYHPPAYTPTLDIFTESNDLVRLPVDAEQSDFQETWRKGIPLVVQGIKLDKDWRPETFWRKYGNDSSTLIDCCTNEFVSDASVGKFFKGFKYQAIVPATKKELKRMETDRIAFRKSLKNESVERMFDAEDLKAFKEINVRNSSSVGADDDIIDPDVEQPKVFKLKDWPSETRFTKKFPTFSRDFHANVPFQEYHRPDGHLNLASKLPLNIVPPDLGPKMYLAYGMKEGYSNIGTTPLHLDMADAINLLVHAEGGTGSIGAIWDIFRQGDVAGVREYLGVVAEREGLKLADAIHDQIVYLSRSRLEELWKDYGIKSYRVFQKVGDAVFIPAGCAHQVYNLKHCIKVACDFVSPEHVDACVRVMREFRRLPTGHHRKQDLLQVKSVVYHYFRWLNDI